MTLRISVPKAWKLEELTQQSYRTGKIDAWVYHCTLCDEVLLVSQRPIDAKGVQAAFDGVCPDCGFDLEDVMNCEHTRLPYTRSSYVNPKHPNAAFLAKLPLRTSGGIKPRNAHLHTGEQILTTGIEKLDKLVHLTTRQLVFFQGDPLPTRLAELMCVRVQLDHPVGLSSDTIFIDGGNSFDVYAASNHAIEYGIEPKLALARIHISRAFTYFQLASLLIEKLSSALMLYNSTFAIVSEITELFQDPEIKDKMEAHRIFQRILRSLRIIAEITGSLVVATSSHRNARPFDTALTQTAHTTILAEEHEAFKRFALVHHKSLLPRSFSNQESRNDHFLEDYLEE